MPRSALNGRGPVWRESLETAALSPRSQSESGGPAAPIGRAATRFTSRRPSRSTITMLPSRGAPRSQGSPVNPAGRTRRRSPATRAGAIESSATTARQMRRAVVTVKTTRYALEAAKDVANASVAATSSAAAAASTLCLFFEASFSSFQTWSCRSGTFVRCSGLK